MAFQKGNSLGGRKLGSVGKSNKQTKEAFALLLNNNLRQITERPRQSGAKRQAKNHVRA